MSTPRKILFSLVMALVMLLLGSSVSFADTIVTDVNGISGFERLDNGIYWWSARGDCSEIFHSATIRVRPTLFSTTKNLAADCDILRGGWNNAVRDEAYIYYFGYGSDAHQHLQRKALNAAQNDAGEPLPAAPPLPDRQFGSYLVLAEGELYWSVYDDATQKSTIERMPADGSQPPKVVISAPGDIRKMKWFHYKNSDGNLVNVLLWVTTDSRLMRFWLDRVNVPTQLATGIADFALHSAFDLVGHATTSIYAAQGALSYGANTQAGKLLSINIDTKATTTIYTATGKHQVVGVTTDSDSNPIEPAKNVYLVEQSITCAELCVPDNVFIKRHALPAADDSHWELIVDSGVAENDAGNLRSDDQWLYYTANNGLDINRVKTNAPPLELDLKADGVEVVQTIQSLGQDVPLVANKPTFVRGYAHLAKNTTGNFSWFPNAELHGFFNNGELPGSPLQPVNSVGLNTTADIATWRGTLQGGFLFQLPASWMQNEGSLTVQLVIDPEQLLPETGSHDDNTTSLAQVATITAKDNTCLDFVRMYTANTIAANPPGLPDILARARSLLPVQDFEVHTSDIVIYKPVLHCCEVECFIVACVLAPYFEDEPFDMSDDDTEALTWLWIWDTLTTDFGDCDDSHLVGMVDPSEQGFNGTSTGNDLVVRMEPDSGPTTFNNPFAGRTLAHELGHNYGREHIDQTASSIGCGGGQPDDPYDDYPYDPCTLGPNGSWIGFDSIASSLILPNLAGDLMSYSLVRWTSDYTWKQIIDEVGAAANVQTAGNQASPAPMLLVSGLITPSQPSAFFQPFYLFPAGMAPASKLMQQQAAQAATAAAPAYLIRQLDAKGAVLAEDNVIAVETHDDAGAAIPFAQYVVFKAQTVRVQLLQGSKVLAERASSAHTPSLSMQPPLVDEAKQTLSLQWLSFDTDNTLGGGFHDVLFFTVQYSPDNGAKWQTVLMQYPWLAATIDTRTLPGSNQARVRVIASDGFNTAIVTSDPFTLAKHAPDPQIGGVFEGERLPFSVTVTLLGLALDAEDGSLPGDQLKWSISGPNPQTATGSQVSLAKLAPGDYAATLTATDADGQTGSATRHFTVLPLVVPDAGTPLLDGLCSDAGYAQADFLRFPLGGDHSARAWLLHAASKLFVCFADLPLAAAGAPLQSVDLRVDANNSGDPQVQAGDLDFVVDEEGIPLQLVASRGALVPTLSPQLGYAAVVDRTAKGWSAELAVDEELVGGWNHAARLMLHEGVLADVGRTGIWPPQAGATQPASWAAAFLGALPAPANRAPVAYAGDDLYLNIAVTKTFSLNGEASADPDGDALTYIWSQVEGTPVPLANGNSATPSLVVPPVTKPTRLRFQLVVRDGSLSSPADEIALMLLPTPQPHTPATYTPPDLNPGGQHLNLPMIVR